MGRPYLMSVMSFAMLLLGQIAWAQANERDTSAPKTTIGVEFPLLKAGADAIRAGLYDKGIELTLRGLETERPPGRTRAGALSNLCAAHAAKREPDSAIEYCTRSLEISSSWRAYSNRSYAHWLKGEYALAQLDVNSAAVFAPKAPQVVEIRGLINEARLEPRIVIEEHQ